jgi:phage shock protein A
MELFDRVGRLFRTNLNDLFSKTEDPEKVLVQAVIDMQEDLVQLRQAMARIVAEQQRTEERYNADLAEANKWQEQADLALSRGDENSARKAMAHKERFIKSSTIYKIQLDELTGQVEALRRNLTVMESKIAEINTSKNELQEQIGLAKTSEERQKLLYGIDTNIARDAFERMEKKVQEMEARSQTMAQVNKTDIVTERKTGFWLNDLVRNAEDPEKMLEQSVIDMQEDLVQFRQAVARVIAEQKRTEQHYNQNLAETNKWQERGDLALSKGDENLAREAMTRKTSFTESASMYKAQLDQLTDQVDTFREHLISLECKISEVKTRKNMLQARAKTARAKQELQKTFSRLDTNNPMGAFERLKRKAQGMETRSQAMGQINKTEIVVEEPEKLLEQSILNIQEALMQLRQVTNYMFIEQKRTEQRYNDNLVKVDKSQQPVDLNLSKKDEDLAQETIIHGESFAESAAIYKALLDKLADQVDAFKQPLTILEDTIADVKTKKNMLQALAHEELTTNANDSPNS